MGGVAVVCCRRAAAVQMDHRARLRKLAAGAMQVVVDREEMSRRQLIMPLNSQGLVFAGFDQRGYGLRTIAPQPRRRQVAMHFYPNFTHGDVKQRYVGIGPLGSAGQGLGKK